MAKGGRKVIVFQKASSHIQYLWIQLPLHFPPLLKKSRSDFVNENIFKHSYTHGTLVAPCPHIQKNTCILYLRRLSQNWWIKT